MDPVNNLKSFLQSWDGSSETIDAGDRSSSVIVAALRTVKSLSEQQLAQSLTNIRDSLENSDLIDKADKLFRIIQQPHENCQIQIERDLGLDRWNGGPETEEAKKRIIDCYLTESNQLDLSCLQLKSIPPCIGDFQYLTNLDCSLNQLAALPDLPESLNELNCSNNQLTSLPDLPESLNELNCSWNYFRVLPTLPNHLSELDCSWNQLTALPYFPESLRTLNYRHNQIPDQNAALNQVEPNDFQKLQQKISSFQEALGEELPLQLKEIDLTLFEQKNEQGHPLYPNFTKKLLDWISLLENQNSYTGFFGKKLLAASFLPLLQLALKDPNYRETVQAQINEALSSCTDRALFTFNALTVARKLKEAKTDEEKIKVLYGCFAFFSLETIAKELIESRLMREEKKLGRKLTQNEIALLKKEEIELYLSLQIQLKEIFQLPIESSEMMFEFCAHLKPHEMSYARAAVAKKLQDREACIDFFVSQPAWAEPIKEKFQGELNSRTVEITNRLDQLHDRLRQIDKDLHDDKENESLINQQLECQFEMGSLMREKESVETAFLKEKTREMLF